MLGSVVCNGYYFKLLLEAGNNHIMAAGGIELPFSIGRLIFLIVWVYLCLYSLQYFQISPIVPDRYKIIASIFGLLLGPVLFIALLVIDSITNYSGISSGFIGRVKEHLQLSYSGLKAIDKTISKQKRGIILLHSSGKDIEDLFGGERLKKQERNILKVTEDIILSALEKQASDILIDPKDNSTYTVRFRVDGMLRTEQQLEFDQCQAVINSIKAVAGMDIAEKRRPQDGAFTSEAGERKFSFRAASAGVIHGEKLSIRVLNYNASSFKLEDVGLTGKQLEAVRRNLLKPTGMMLLCGPTGCGKTTTLYAMLNEIDLFSRNVITVEDPIECVLANASQIEVNPKADITFAKSLRSILRQDPDVICVGEIRDEETASIALRAAQTGHLVLATVHSNSTASALLRLMDLGTSPLLIASGLNILIAQRLVRKLCEYCKQPAKLKPSQIETFKKRGMDYTNLYSAVGCECCSGTGYKGRTAICDILVLDSDLRNAISNGKLPVEELRVEGDRRGSSNLQKEGLKKVFLGITSIEELQRVAG